MTNADQPPTFGAVVRRLRRHAAIEPRELARAIAISPQHLRNIENGHRKATPQTAAALDRALSAGGMLTELAACGDDTMRRRALLHGLTLLAMPTGTTPGHTRHPVGHPEVESLRTITATFRKLDNRFGGAHSYQTASSHLTDHAMPLLSARFTDRVGAQLLSAIAELAQLVGWTAYDSGMHSLARQHFNQARQWAETARDRPLVAEIYAAMSHQSAFLGNGTEAVTLADAALGAAVPSGIPALVAEARMAAAHGSSVDGNAPEAARLLTLAEQTLDHADRSADPEWIGYFDSAYLAAKTGHCLLATGDAAGAVTAAEQSLNMDNTYVRGRMFNLALLAQSLIQAREPEQACLHGNQALTLAGNLRSARANEYLRRIAVGLTPYRELPAARDLINDIGEHLTPIQ